MLELYPPTPRTEKRKLQVSDLAHDSFPEESGNPQVCFNRFAKESRVVVSRSITVKGILTPDKL